MGNGTISPMPYKSPIAIPPGDTIKEFMEAASMTQTELAHRMNRPIKTINEIIKGKKSIIEDTAVQLEKVLGSTADFWLTLECNYQLTKARLSEQAKLKKQLTRTQRFPYAEMAHLGIVPSERDIQERTNNILRFLQVANYNGLDRYIEKALFAYRRSPQFELPIEKLAVWLRMGELAANRLNLKPFSIKCLEDKLSDIRQLTLVPIEEILPKLQEIGSECGVAFLFIPGFKSFPVNGLVRWRDRHPYVQVRPRYKRHDILWFTIFHEIGHIILHGRRNRGIFIEPDKNIGTNEFEEEADQFAANTLIPPDVWNELSVTQKLTKAQIKQTAKEIDIAPGLIVGRLQRERVIQNSAFNDLHIRLNWVE